MFARHLLTVLTLLSSIAAATPAAAQLCPPMQDPCTIANSATIAAGIYDIRPRALVIKASKTVTVSGSGDFKIQASNVTLEPGARIIAPGADGNVSVLLEATGTLTMESQGTSKSKIDVSGNFGGGHIALTAAGDVSINGSLEANAANLLGFGGPIDIASMTGSITVTGDPSEGVKSLGNAQGGGGSITLSAFLGSVSVSTQLVAKGGDCGSCEVNIEAGGDVTTTAQGMIDITASGAGDGGFLSIFAGGSVSLVGDIFANGSGDEMDGGAGGDIGMTVAGSLSVAGRMELNGASPDGDGGTVDLEAGTTISQTGVILTASKGFGQADDVSFDALGNITLGNTIDVSGDWFAADITVFSEGLVTVSGRLRSDAPFDPLKPDALGGSIEIDACQVNVTAPGEIISTGPGGDPSGSIFLNASTGLTVAGKLTATTANLLTWRSTPPMILGTATITPDETISQNLALPCCGVGCTTTTTTTTTTTSTTTTSTTSTTTTTVPGSTTTTVTAPSTSTTTSTTATTIASTTSTTTSTVTTSTSTTVTTTSTTATSTTSTTTTTSSTTVPTSSTTTTTSSTTTTSATVPPTTTTTTIPSCLDTALGIDAVRCRLDIMTRELGTASQTDLGGKKLAKSLTGKVTRAHGLVGDPVKTKRLRGAARQLKKFSTIIGRGLAKGKVEQALGEALSTLAADASLELQSLLAP